MLLEKLARDVIAAWEAGQQHAGPIDALKAHLDEISSDRTAHGSVITTAREDYADFSNNDIEIDDEPFLSVGEEGIWVSAWVYVSTLSEDEEEEEEED